MNRALLPVAVALGAAALAAAPERAWAICSVLDRHPCTPYAPSVLRNQPFLPYSCGVTGGPCSPQPVLIVGGTPVLRITGHAGPSAPIDRGQALDRITEVGPLLSKCLELPPEPQAGMELALRFAFKRDGELMADPQFTYTTPDAPDDVKAAYHAAALDMLRRCAPLPITARFGRAIAGHPIIVAIRDARGVPPESGRDDAAAPAPPVAGPKP